MKSCCEAKASELEKLRLKQGRVLKIVLAVNAVMFLIEATFGVLSKSTALLADSLDMFGDATVYGFSLYVLNRNNIWKSRGSLERCFNEPVRRACFDRRDLLLL